jgi:hypothetical protein
MWYRGVSAGGFALAWACFGNSAWAAEARLSYERAAGAESCPDIAGLRDAVRSRLGYDPFTETATASLVVSIAASDTGLRGVVKSFDASGVRVGERELTVHDETCEELVQALAVSICIAIDPEEMDKDSPEPSEGHASQPEPASKGEPAPEATDRTREPRRRSGSKVVPFLSADLMSIAGATPNVALGASAGGGVRIGGLSLGGEVRGFLPSVGQLETGGEFQARVLAAGLAFCWHVDPLAACGVGVVGELYGKSKEIDDPNEDSRLYAAAGARASGEIPLSDWFSVRAQLELLATLVRVTAELDDRRVWNAPPASGSVSLGALVHFQ